MDSKYWTTGRLNQSYDKWPQQRLADLKAQVARSKWWLGYHIQTRTVFLILIINGICFTRRFRLVPFMA